MSYVRVGIVVFIILICFFAFFRIFFSGAERNLDESLDLFLKGNGQKAEKTLQKIESDLPPSQYLLYQAYIARENNQLEQSNEYLLKSVEHSNNEKGDPFLLEIYLNQAFNAYLARDPQALAEPLAKAKQMFGKGNGWVPLFLGIQDYFNHNCFQAIANWQYPGERIPLSPWMKKAFEDVFTPFWFTSNVVRCEIEEGKYIQARQDLEFAMPHASQNVLEEINFLLGLSYIKEAQEKPANTIAPYYKLALSYFQHVPMQNERFTEERQRMAARIYQNLLTLIDNHELQDLSLYVSTLENWQAYPELEKLNAPLTILLNHEIDAGNWKTVQEITTALNRTLKSEQERLSISRRFQDLLTNALEKGDIIHLQQFWEAARSFSTHPDQLAAHFSKITEEKIVQLVPIDNPTLSMMMPYITFWKEVEKNPHERSAFAAKLVTMADDLWTKHHEVTKAQALMEVASSLPLDNDRSSLYSLIERSIANIYDAALKQDDIDQFFDIFEAVQRLKLVNIPIRDPNEIEKQLQIAEASYADKNYEDAAKRAEWILRLTPLNQAIRIVGLANFYAANYSQALPYLTSISPADREVLEAIAVSNILSGDLLQGNRLLNELAAEHPLNRDVYLRLGFGALIVNNPKASLEWFKQVSPDDSEVYAGISFADYLLHDWNQMLGNFHRLTPPYSNLWGLQGAAIASYAAVGQNGFAEQLLQETLAEIDQPPNSIFSPIFAAFKKKKLDSLNRYAIAGSFYKNVTKNNEKAMDYFNLISHPSPEDSLQKAEIYIAWNQTDKARQVLENVLQQVAGDVKAIPIKKRLLPLLATIYEKETEFPEAVDAYMQYFSLEEDDNNLNYRAAYAKSLMQIRRYDLALQQFQILKKAGKLFSADLAAYIESLVKIGDFDQANMEAKAALALQPPLSLENRLQIARFMIITQNLALVRDVLKDLPETDKRSLTADEELIRIWTTLGEYDKAIALADQIRGALESNPEGLMVLAQLNVKLSNLSEALALAHRADEFNQYNLRIEEMISHYERNPEFFKNALEAFQTEMNTHSKNLSWQIAYARTLLDYAIENQKEQQKGFQNISQLHHANRLLENLALLHPDNPQIFFFLGQVYFLLDRYHEAIQSYEKALKLDKSYVDAYKYFALAESEMGNTQKAILNLQQAVTYSPDDAESWLLLGLLEEKMGNSMEAIIDLQKAVKFSPNDPTPYLKIASFHLELNNPEEAKNVLEKALKFNPKNITALKMLLIALHDPDLHTDETKSQSLLETQGNVYEALYALDPKEAEAILSELTNGK
jgi:tetratricopeptide (TPR) repeat protein/L-rhamnose mutarotase